MPQIQMNLVGVNVDDCGGSIIGTMPCGSVPIVCVVGVNVDDCCDSIIGIMPPNIADNCGIKPPTIPDKFSIWPGLGIMIGRKFKKEDKQI
jgi:hypothetical protein